MTQGTDETEHETAPGANEEAAHGDIIDALPFGVIVVNVSGTVKLCSSAALALLDLPADFPAPPFHVGQLTGRLAQMSAETADDAALLERPDGRTIRLGARRMTGGSTLLLVEDVTESVDLKRHARQAEQQFRSLFENSVYGIYRDTVDGQPVRVNPALAAFNGYVGEAEHIEAVKTHGGSWYVEPKRGEELLRVLQRDGRVSDFVSQVKRHRTGEAVWVTENAWYVRDDSGTPVFIEGTIQDATERMMAAEALSRQVRTDALTGCASRHHFLERLNEAVAAAGTGFALYCVDLDMFKEINDLFGHATGDDVLKAVAARLRDLTQTGDLVARLGGDEFAILSFAENDIRNPELLGQAIVETMRAPVGCEGRNHVVPASVGIAVFPRHGENSSELLRNADTALYEAKARGRNSWRLFDQELRQVLAHRKDIETNLRTAIVGKELELYYQAIVDSGTGVVTGFEGLMRWHSPKLGRVAPGEFIPIAEQSGLMMDLGAWAISRCCEDAAIFHKDLRFGVNVSASQFHAHGLVSHVAHELDRFGVTPDRLVVEITESVLVTNESAARHLLNDLRRLGVQIAIDDFGTGYSSLSYLQHLPINVVKIDRSFVAGMLSQKANRSVIRAIMAIGRDLGIRVVAEGIETEEQADALRNEGCQYFQGYLFSKPKPLSEIVGDLAVAQLGRPLPQAVPRKTA